ncbi:hypothetical protein P7K49_024567, partial [Saguinus oedipus]
QCKQTGTEQSWAGVLESVQVPPEHHIPASQVLPFPCSIRCGPNKEWIPWVTA